MLESKLKKRSTILPVFFHVKPSELRWTEGEKGVYAQALCSLREKRRSDSLQPRYDSNIIGKWKDALHDVAEISGFELDEAPYNGDEGQLLADVVQRVLAIVPKTPPNVAKYPTGLEDKVKDFETTVLLQTPQETGEARVVGIVGLGGVGKTTLAKEFFKRERANYLRSCLLSDVRASGYLNSLQSKLLKELSQGNNVQINNTDEGIEELRKYLRSSHALINLDDVDHIDQLDALLSPAKDVLNFSSLILVTSRDKRVLKNWGIEDRFIYKLEGLNPEHSTELFCWHAFHQRLPVARFEQVVNEFVDACGRLPLSLKVTGALLYGEKNLEHWKAQLRKISKILPADIQNRLRISYDSLDEEEKQIFLDTACFFIGEEKDTAIRIWDGSGWEGSLGLQNLQNKCLVEVEVEVEWVWKDAKTERIRMHDHLRDLGRYLANKNKEPSRRIWHVTENLFDRSPVREMKNSAERDRMVTELVTDLRLHPPDHKGSCVESVFSVDQPPQLIMIRWYNCPCSLISNISTENLRILFISGSNLEKLWDLDESKAPLELRELYIKASMLFKIPESIGQLKHLEKIVLQGYDFHTPLLFEALPDEFCQLPSLKHLKLKRCPYLRSLPDSFGNLTSLEHVILYWCSGLEMLPDSFGNLTKLQHIDLNSCQNLQMLPDSFGNLTKLQHIDLNSCQNLQMLPDSFGNLTKLQHIDFSCCKGLQMLPNSFGSLTNLQHIDFSYCKGLQMLPNSFGSLTNLQHIDFSLCEKLQMLPNSFGNLTNLQHIRLTECQELQMPPNSLGNLIQLKFLYLTGCKKLTISSETLGKITTLEEFYLSGIEVLPPQLPYQQFLQSLYLEFDSKELSSAIGNLGNLKILRLRSSCLEFLPPSFGDLRSLEELELFCCPLKCFPGSIRRLTRLKKLKIAAIKNLKQLEIKECPSREVGEEVETATDSIGREVLSKMDASEGSYSNAVFPNLQHLQIQYCDRLVEVRALPTTLQTLDIKNCGSLVELGALPTALQTLVIANCTELEELPSMETLVSLEELVTGRCRKLKRIHGLAHLTKLKELHVNYCSELEELPGVEHSRSLKEVWAVGCPKLQPDYESLHRTCKYIFNIPRF